MSAPAERGFATLSAAQAPTVTAPDGASVQVLLSLQGGSMATFTLQPGQVSAAVTHRSVEELWYVVAGRGRMWRRDAAREEIVALEPGLCLSVPLGTAFQFRCDGDAPLVAVAVTMPPWPGEGEAVIVEGAWGKTRCRNPREECPLRLTNERLPIKLLGGGSEGPRPSR